MVGFRAAPLSGACLATILLANATSAVAAEQHGKSAKQCNDELKSNATAIEAAHESASAFFHACWWHTAAGHKTPIEADAKPTADTRKAPAEASSTRDRVRPPDERESSARPARHAMHWEERRFYRVSRPAPGDETVPLEPVEAGPVAVDASTGASLSVRPPSVQAPLVERLPVTVVGVPSAVVLPVLPAYAPLVRQLLNNPAVPGLTAAP